MILKTVYSSFLLGLVFFSSLFLCSCAGKRSAHQSVNPSKISFSAQICDVSVPLGFTCTEKRISKEQDGPLLIACYKGGMALAKVVAFYRRELEAAGWDLSNFSCAREGLFFCHKGSQECIISIRSKGATKIIITHKGKTGACEVPSNNVAKINQTLQR